METSNKSWVWILIVVVVLALLFLARQYGFFNKLVTQKEVTISNTDDTTAEIDKDLNTVDLGNPNQDLKQLDTDLNQL